MIVAVGVESPDESTLDTVGGWGEGISMVEPAELVDSPPSIMISSVVGGINGVGGVY